MSIKDKYKVLPIETWQTKDWLLKKHYARRVPAIEHAFGIYDGQMLFGVLTFGPPPRVMNNGESVFNEYRVKTFELNRLCISETDDRNTLSYFVSCALKLLPSPCCVVSYADHSFGHHGYIYQATNWVYCGLNQIHERQVFYNGEEVHPRTACSMGFTSMTEWAKKDPKVTLGEYTSKHRYLYFVGTKTEARRMKADLIYPVLPYPKGENKRYDASHNPEVQLRMFVE